MADRIRYFEVDEETFYMRHAPFMRGRFNHLSIDSRLSADSYLMMGLGQDTVVGYCKLSFYGEVTRATYLEIATDYRRRGYGPRLYAEVFRRAAKRGDTLMLTPYTRMGQANLKDHQEGLERRYYPHLLVVNEYTY